MAGKGKEGKEGGNGEETKEDEDGREAGNGIGEEKEGGEEEEEQGGKVPCAAAVDRAGEAAAQPEPSEAAGSKECQSVQGSSDRASGATERKGGSWWGRWMVGAQQNGQEKEKSCAQGGQNGQRIQPSPCRGLRDAVQAAEQLLLPQGHERGPEGSERVDGSDGGNEGEWGASGQVEGEVSGGRMRGARRGNTLPDPAAALSAVEELLGRVKAVEGEGSERGRGGVREEEEGQREEEDVARWKSRILMCKVRPWSVTALQ